MVACGGSAALALVALFSSDIDANRWCSSRHNEDQRGDKQRQRQLKSVWRRAAWQNGISMFYEWLGGMAYHLGKSGRWRA